MEVSNLLINVNIIIIHQLYILALVSKPIVESPIVSF